MRVFIALVGSIALLAGCAPDEIVLTLDLRTDFVPGEQFLLVYSELAPSEEGGRVDEDLYRPTDGDDFVADVRVAEFRNVADGSYVLNVRLEQLDGFVIGRQSVPLVLTKSFAARATILMNCPTGEEPGCGCSEDVDCAEHDNGCVVGRCIEGGCFASREDELCDVGEICTASGGCRYDGSCDAASCDRVECTGESCDDGDACTFDDRCTAGACAGTPITCTSTTCASSTCNGSDTCTVTNAAAGTACEGDRNGCTNDVCNGNGACAHLPLEDGTPWPGGDLYDHCCGGERVRVLGNTAHCGQCNARCQAGQTCEGFMGTPTCHCTGPGTCPYGAVCVFGWCACENDGQCDEPGRCQISPGHQYCTYY